MVVFQLYKCFWNSTKLYRQIWQYFSFASVSGTVQSCTDKHGSISALQVFLEQYNVVQTNMVVFQLYKCFWNSTKLYKHDSILALHVFLEQYKVVQTNMVVFQLCKCFWKSTKLYSQTLQYFSFTSVSGTVQSCTVKHCSILALQVFLEQYKLVVKHCSILALQVFLAQYKVIQTNIVVFQLLYNI